LISSHPCGEIPELEKKLEFQTNTYTPSLKSICRRQEPFVKKSSGIEAMHFIHGEALGFIVTQGDGFDVMESSWERAAGKKNVVSLVSNGERSTSSSSAVPSWERKKFSLLLLPYFLRIFKFTGCFNNWQLYWQLSCVLHNVKIRS